MKMYFDGAYYKQFMGYGYIIKDHDWTVQTRWGGMYEPPPNKASSNMAEYLGLEAGLRYLKDHPEIRFNKLEIIGDSKLVINQMSGKWRVSSGIYADTAREVIDFFNNNFHNNVKFTWTRRENNREADRLSKIGLKQTIENMNLKELKWDINSILREREFVQIEDTEYWMNTDDGSRVWQRGDIKVFNCPFPCGYIKIYGNDFSKMYSTKDMVKPDFREVFEIDLEESISLEVQK